MIGRRFSRDTQDDEEEPRGFDDFQLRLGDQMRGERATLGKSLLDVERELRIRAAYVAAIENADPSVFDTPGFIPGYVRSYARYLGMDPDRAFGAFCDESGFSTAHGMSAKASSRRAGAAPVRRTKPASSDPLIMPNTPFLPPTESFLARIEPGAVGSALVLVALIAAIGYGGWSVLTEVQRVQVVPVENTPDVLSDLDPLSGATARVAAEAEGTDGVFATPRGDRLTRLYRPEALDVPVMVARDGPISTLDPRDGGTLRPDLPRADRSTPRLARDDTGGATETPAAAQQQQAPKVVADARPDLRVIAVRPAWVRVSGADGTVLYEGILNGGDTYDVPATEEAPTLRVGESGAVYFAVAGRNYGPAGARGQVTSGLVLAPDALTGRYALADPMADTDLLRYVAEVQRAPTPQE